MRVERTGSGEAPCSPERLLAVFGDLDIYLFDQLLRGRITPRMRVLDAGCGGGRNALYLMRCGSDVFGIDADPNEVARIQAMAAEHAPGLESTNFRVARLTDIPFPAAFFDAVICSAVLHFAENESEFEGSVGEMWRVLRPGGVFFARLASTIGVEGRVERREGRWHRLPDGSDRFLVDEAYLLSLTRTLGATLLDPLKTTNVQNLRAMTTWVLGKPEPAAGTL
ncbi:MAG: class I SAM-dependent methyltransferase [Gemmatimonadota bacterium]|nr:class I SAM-dependent methyltransferase [Gemmatimonadota bacterium]